MLPVLSYTVPDAAAQALRWQHSTLPTAVTGATQLGMAGAACHINAYIAAAVACRVRAAGTVSTSGPLDWSVWATASR